MTNLYELANAQFTSFTKLLKNTGHLVVELLNLSVSLGKLPVIPVLATWGLVYTRTITPKWLMSELKKNR